MAHRGNCIPLSESASDRSAVLTARRSFAASFQNVRYARLGWIVIQVIVQTIHNHNAAGGGSSEGPHDGKRGLARRFRKWRHFALLSAIAALQFSRYADYEPAEYFATNVDHTRHNTQKKRTKQEQKSDSVVALQRTDVGPR